MRILCGTIITAAISAFGAVEKDKAVAIHSATTNGVEVRWFEEMVPMKDGVRLYTYGALPPEGETRGIVFRRTPYVQEKPVDMPAYALSQRGTLKRGYAYVEQHVRGTGMSEGAWVPYENEREDGLAMLEWLRRLPHYGGEIFLSGGSYLSSVHFSYLGTNPPDVKGAALFVQDVNRYNVAYRNGFFKAGLHGGWFVKGYRKKDKSLPRNGQVTFSDFPLADFSRRYWGEAVPALDNKLRHPRPDDPFWRSHEPGSGVDYLDAISSSTMPILLKTGFYDIYTDGVCEMWRGMSATRRSNCALVIDAYDHGGRMAQWAKGTRGEFPGGLRADVGVSDLDWFDYCRTGRPVANAQPGKTRYYALWENTWKEEPELVDGTRKVRLSLGEGARTWVYDPRRPLPQFPGSGGICFGGMQLQPPPNFRDDVVSFVLPPMEGRLDVRGRMKMELAVSSDCEDTCFYVRVSVDKGDGKWYLLRDDITSLSFAGGKYAPGTERSISFCFADHAFRLEKGDILRVDVSSANSQFAPHPNVAGDAFACSTPKVAHNTVFPGRSFLELPAVGAVGVAAGRSEKATADFVLVKGGKAVAAFEFGTMPDEKAKAAAEKDVALFNRHLKEVTGVELGARSDPAFAEAMAGTGDNASCQNKIRVDLKPIDDLATRFDWKIDFPAKGVMRVEATTTSLFTALRQLIEEGCDARFLGTERCMFQFKPRKDVSVEACTRRNAPHNFSLLRDIYGTKGNRRELGLASDGLFKYTHGIPLYAFPSDTYNRDGWPEAILPVKKGKKIERPPANPYCGWQPCYSNPETARLAVENIRAWLRKNPGAKSTTLGVNDLGGYCECETCKALDAGAEKSIFANDRQNHSASYYTFVNRVAAALVDEFPDLRIGLLAYVDTIMPPKFEVARNVVPMMTFDTHSAGIDQTVRAKHESVIRRWGEKVRETGTWDYSWGGGYYIPRVDFANRAARLKFLYANGGRAYFGENSMPDALDGPKTYLTARLLENVDADADAILGEWYSRFAGKAAEKPLREIYRLSTEYWRSDEMKKSALWPARTWIYNYPYGMQYFALTPGFTERLLALAREVRGNAATPGEKARAEVLLRHFERLDCMASFKGMAYMAPGSGELVGAADAAKMLEDFAARADGLFAAWARVRRYFLESPDFDNPEVYGKWRGAYETTALLAEQFGKAAGFAQDPAVAAALGKVAKLKCLPDDVRTLLGNVISGGGANCFSNPGFAKALDETRIKTTLPHELVDGEGGRKVLRIWPGRPKGEPNPGDQALWNVAVFSMTENLGAGFYMVSAKVRSAAKAARGDMVAWAQLDGADRGWEALRPTALKKGESHTFVQVKRVRDTEDGLNVKLRVQGFSGNDVLDVEDVKIVKLMDVRKSGRAKSLSVRGITAREGTVRETVRGEDAIVCKSDSYAFAHAVVDVPRILPNERLVFTLRATLPEGAKTGQLGAILYRQKNGGWEPGPQMLWNRRLSAKGWDGVEFSVTGAQLGKKSGKYLLILFKMKNTDAVAVSGVSWTCR